MQQKSQPLISILVPYTAHQREAVEALTTLDAWGSSQKHTYEIITISLCADARVRESITRYGMLIPHVRSVSCKSGTIGTIIQQNILEARGLIRIWIPTPACAVCICLYEKLEHVFREGADIVILHPSFRSRYSVMRMIQATVSFLLHGPVVIPFGSCVAYSQKAALAVFPHTQFRSRGIISESLVRARTQGLRVRELITDRYVFSRGNITAQDIIDLLRLIAGVWISAVRSFLYSVFISKRKIK